MHQFKACQARALVVRSGFGAVGVIQMVAGMKGADNPQGSPIASSGKGTILAWLAYLGIVGRLKYVGIGTYIQTMRDGLLFSLTRCCNVSVSRLSDRPFPV